MAREAAQPRILSARRRSGGAWSEEFLGSVVKAYEVWDLGGFGLMYSFCWLASAVLCLRLGFRGVCSDVFVLLASWCCALLSAEK